MAEIILFAIGKPGDRDQNRQPNQPGIDRMPGLVKITKNEGVKAHYQIANNRQILQNNRHIQED